MRVAYCIDGFVVGGTELNAVRTAEALVAAGIDLTVFHFHETGPLRERYDRLNVPMIHLPISQLYSGRTFRQSRRFAAELVRRRIEVVHAHDVYTNIFAVPTARVCSSAGVLASRRWWFEVPRPGLSTLNRWSYSFAHLVLANSAGVARLLVDNERLPPRKVVEVSNFVDDSFFVEPPSAECEARRRCWGVPSQATLFGIVARLVPVKNHQLLIRAMSLLPASCHLVVVGSGPLEEGLRALAADSGVRDRVHFAGELVDVGNVHWCFDASVLCSRSEGFPNTVIEALAAARPVVSTNVGGVPDVLRNGETGLLVEQDARVLADAMRRLHEDPVLRFRLGAAGRAEATRQYGKPRAIGKLLEIYSRLARLPLDERQFA